MTTRTTGTIAAGMLAIGIVVGAAGTIAANDGTPSGSVGFMGGGAGMNAAGMNSGHMGGTGMGTGMGAGMNAAGMNAAGMNAAGMNAAGMNGGHMGGTGMNVGTMGADMTADMARMMSMMSAGTSTWPDPAISPENHRLHHSSPSPSAT